MIAAWKSKLTDAFKSLSGNKDFLEAVCAAAALTASADGDVSDAELAATVKAVGAHPNLAKAYKQGEIEKCADTMLKRAQQGRLGRNGLYKEIDQVAASTDMAETVYLCALDIAESDGNVADKERAVLREIAKRLGVNEASLQV